MAGEPDGRLQLRSVLQTKLGMPSRVEVWAGRDLIGFITGTGADGLLLTAVGRRLDVGPASGSVLVVRFHEPSDVPRS